MKRQLRAIHSAGGQGALATALTPGLVGTLQAWDGKQERTRSEAAKNADWLGTTPCLYPFSDMLGGLVGPAA
jgi:hypothetical protein